MISKKKFILCRWHNGQLRGYLVNSNTGNMRRMFVAHDITAVPDRYKAHTLNCLLQINERPAPKLHAYDYETPIQLRQFGNLTENFATMEYEE